MAGLLGNSLGVALLEIWRLKFLWMLMLGAWSFFLTGSDGACKTHGPGSSSNPDLIRDKKKLGTKFFLSVDTCPIG